jgi:hypothetical protein
MTATEGSASADTLALLAGLMRDRSEAQTKRPVGTIADTSTLGTPTS